MKKYSLLVGLVFGILIFSFASNVPYASAAQGDIGAIVESLNFEGFSVTAPDIIQVSGDTFAIAYVTSGNEGKLVTIRVDSTGDILTNAIITSATISENTITDPKIIHITGDRYLIVFGDGNNITASVFQINNNGATALFKTTSASIISTGSDPDVVKLSGAAGATQYYAIAYTGSGAGLVDTISVTTGDVITNETGAAVSFATNSGDPEIIKVSGTTYAVAFRDNTNVGHVETLTIPDDGNLNNATVDVGNLAANLNGGTAISSSSNLDIVHVTGEVYAVAWSDGTDGKIQTVTINDAGTTLAVSGGGTGVSFATTNVVNPVLIQTDIVASPFAFLVAYYDSTNTDGVLKSFTITNAGAISSVIDTLNYHGANGQNPVVAHRTGDFYVVAYEGTSLGTVSSFNLGDADVTPPSVTSVGLLSNNANTALAISGNTVTITVVDDEELNITAVTIGGQAGTIGTNNANTVTATRTLTGTETEGTLDFSITVADVAGNGVTLTAVSGGGADVTSDFTAPSVSSVVITSNGNAGFARSGQNVIVTVIDGETLTMTAQTIDGKTATAGGSPGTTVTATRTMDGSETTGTLAFSVTVADAAGNPVTLTATTDSSAIVADFTGPTFVSAAITGNGDLNFVFSESVLSAAGDYVVEWPDGSAVTKTLAGSGSKTILLDTVAVDPEGDDAIDYSISASTTDLAGNALSPTIALANPQIASTPFVQPTLTAANNQVVLSANTLITSISASGVSPDLNLVGLPGAAGTATFPSTPITLTTSNAAILFPASVVVAGLPTDEIIEASVSTKTAIGLPTGETAGIIIELGDPNDDTITLSAPVRVTLTGQSGNTPFIVTSTVTVLVPDCTTGSATIAPTLTTTDPTLTTSHCAIDAGADLIIWTRHFTGFGSSSVISSGGGGSSSGDSSAPSINVGFDQNEYPLKYDGINYLSDQLDSPHTAIIGTGDELKTTLTLYDNSGAASIQHVEQYVYQFGSQILNDLTETIVIYDEQSGLEIIDPHNLIATADVIPSVSGNKAVFDFVIVFKDEIPKSDVLFRVWDIKRNSMQITLPDALIVNISEQSNNIITMEPESEVSDTETESESIVPEDVSEAAPQVAESVPGISEPSPEVKLPAKTWTSGQLSVLKEWGGYEAETASDLDVLAKFGIKGEKIPSHFKQIVAWILKDQISQEEFVNALQYLKREGMLSNSVGTKSFDVPSQKELGELTLEKKFFDDTMKFEFDANKFNIKANFDDLENKVRILRALANNEIIQNELAISNMEFNELDDPVYLINQRDSEWTYNPNIVTPFMDSLMNNESALIAKAIIEHDADSLVPLTSIAITNSYGVNIIITEKTQDYNQSDEQWWSKTKADSVHIISGSSSEQQSGLYTAEVSTIINDSEGNFIGIIKAVVNFEKVLLSD